ncbi:MAG: hypothetical protein ACFFBP_03520 [Promethearchaeota archaeon]
MDKVNFGIIKSLLKDIDKKKLDLELYIQNLPIPSRNEMMKEIMGMIVLKNNFFKELGIPIDKIYSRNKKKEGLIQNFVDELITNINTNPNKKIIYLREFLNTFSDINESDRNVILQSLKDENIVNLKEKILTLVDMFKFELK